MAKKQLSVSDVTDILNELNPWGGILEENQFSIIHDYIPTGNYILNALMSGDLFAGIPVNRSSAFGGESGSGKTFLCLNAVREAQKKGYYVVYFDSENAVDNETAKKFGIDTTKISYEPVATVFEFKSLVKQTTDKLLKKQSEGFELPKLFFVLDSLGNLSTTKEQEDAKAGKDKVDMTRAKELKSLFRIITMDLAKLKIPFLLTNHTYDSQDLFSKPVFSGGGGAIFNCSIITMLRKAKLKERVTEKDKSKGFETNGIIVTASTLKNRLAKPIKIKFYIDFTRGMNPYVGLHEFVSWDICGIEKNAKWDEKKQKKMRSNNGKYLVEHLGNKLVSAKDLFTPEVFTEEVLQKLNEAVIKPLFMFSDGSDDEIIDIEIDEAVDQEEENEE